MKKFKYLSQNSQSRRSGEIANCLFETYEKSAMPHGRHIYETEPDMTMATMCAYDGVQTKIPPLLSFYGTQQKQFLLCRN